MGNSFNYDKIYLHQLFDTKFECQEVQNFPFNATNNFLEKQHLEKCHLMLP